MICIANVDTEFGEITILKFRKTGALLYSQGGWYQSEADRQGISTASYIHAIFAMLRQAGSRDVLMIGCGGGTLATMLRLSGVKVTIVDVNPQSFKIARQYFRMPDDVRCHVSDGRQFLIKHPKQYDAIVLDAYQSDRIPSHLCTPDFFLLARLHLSGPRAFLIANVHVSDDLDQTPDRFATEMQRVWKDVRILDARGTVNRNALVMAGRVLDLRQPVLLMPPEGAATDIASDLDRLVFRPRRSPRKT